MKYIETVLLLITAVVIIAVLYGCYKTGKPLKNLFYYFLINFIFMAIINNTAFLTGIYIPINLYTVAATGVYGISGIIGLILLSLIFGL